MELFAFGVNLFKLSIWGINNFYGHGEIHNGKILRAIYPGGDKPRPYEGMWHNNE